PIGIGDALKDLELLAAGLLPRLRAARLVGLRQLRALAGCCGDRHHESDRHWDLLGHVFNAGCEDRRDASRDATSPSMSAQWSEVSQDAGTRSVDRTSPGRHALVSTERCEPTRRGPDSCATRHQKLWTERSRCLRERRAMRGCWPEARTSWSRCAPT